MQETLASNRLPLPSNFNGLEWNSNLDKMKKRKKIPSYLREDLPKLKYQLLREQFKAVSQFECPRLDYFSKIIRQRHSHSCSKSNHDCTDRQANRSKKEKKRLLEAWQYALLTSDRSGNVIDELLSNTQKIQKKSMEDRTNLRLEHGTPRLQSNNCKNLQKNFKLPLIASTSLYGSKVRETIDIRDRNDSSIGLQCERYCQMQEANLSARQSETVLGVKYKKSSKKVKDLKTKVLMEQIKAGKHFSNTIQLIFRQKKSELLRELNRQESPEDHIPLSTHQMVDSIELRSLQE